MKKSIVILVVVLVVVLAVLAAGWFLLKPSSPPAVIAVADPDTAREINSGSLVGVRGENGSHKWLGIPFAAPPVGAMRWRAPMPEAPFEATLQALEVGDSCTQIWGRLSGAPEPETGQVVGEEDCLYLNVFAPPYAPGEVPVEENRVPVMVWIHGGGNSIGHGGSPNYDGGALASTHDVIVVTFNYRLGPFGWFLHPGLQDDTSSRADGSGNYGTLDIIRALHWVRINISQFGGDPENVTIFGESAGGTDVLSMMISPLARGLFDRAIVQSGGLTPATVAEAQNYSDDDMKGHDFSSREVVNHLLVREGRAANREQARDMQESMQPAELAQFMRGLSAATIMSVYEGTVGGMISSPKVIGDGFVLARGDLRTIFSDQSRYNPVPVILGSNRDEAKLFMALNPKFVKNLLGFIPRIIDESTYDRDARYSTDLWKIRGVDDLAPVLTETQGESVFAYRFDWDEEGSVLGFDLSRALGAAHGLEIAFIFRQFGKGPTMVNLYDENRLAGRDALSRTMMSYWAEFAYSGSPGSGRDGTEVPWGPWVNGEEQAPRLLLLDTPQDQGVRMSSEWMKVEDVKQRFLSDTSYASQQEYCDAYKQMFTGAAFDQDEYAALGGGC